MTLLTDFQGCHCTQGMSGLSTAQINILKFPIKHCCSLGKYECTWGHTNAHVCRISECSSETNLNLNCMWFIIMRRWKYQKYGPAYWRHVIIREHNAKCKKAKGPIGTYTNAFLNVKQNCICVCTNGIIWYFSVIRRIVSILEGGEFV